MANLNRFCAPLWDLDTFHIFDDFAADQSDLFWIDTVTDTGTVLMGDARKGIATLTPSDASVVEDDEVYLASANELFLFAAGKPIYVRFRLRYTEVTANKLHLAVGFQNAVGANSIVDTTGLPKVTGSTLAIYKTGGATSDPDKWKCVSACNGTATHTTSSTAAVAATDYDLEIICNDWTTTTMQVAFKVDGVFLKDANANIIRHTVLIASATEMQVFAGAKLGAATNNDTVLLDYVYAAQLR